MSFAAAGSSWPPLPYELIVQPRDNKSADKGISKGPYQADKCTQDGGGIADVNGGHELDHGVAPAPPHRRKAHDKAHDRPNDSKRYTQFYGMKLHRSPFKLSVISLHQKCLPELIGNYSDFYTIEKLNA